MVYLKILAGCGRKTLFAGTNSTLSLLITGGVTEVCGRSADVVYIALEVGHCGNYLSLVNYAFLTS